MKMYHILFVQYNFIIIC